MERKREHAGRLLLRNVVVFLHPVFPWVSYCCKGGARSMPQLRPQFLLPSAGRNCLNRFTTRPQSDFSLYVVRGFSVQDLLQRFDMILNTEDVLAVARGVDQLTKDYLSRSADPASRVEVANLLEQKAEESSNPVLTNYLRTVALCIRQHKGSNAGKCIDAETHRNVEQFVDHRQRRLTPLGEFFARHGSKPQ